MYFELIIDENQEEKVVVYAKEETALVKAIKALANGSKELLMGYKNDDFVPIDLSEVYCFTIEKCKLYAVMEKEKLLLKQRLYQIEELLGADFVKINQSSVANLKKIDRFSASLGGSLIVKFKNGYRDYVSRRQVKAVKERMGIK